MSKVLERSRVLIVDDEEANVRILDRILRHSGCTEITIARTASEAVRGFISSRPDIVLLDLHLPDASGLEVLERLNSLIPADDLVPVVMLTGDTSLEAKKQALARTLLESGGSDVRDVGAEGAQAFSDALEEEELAALIQGADERELSP